MELDLLADEDEAAGLDRDVDVARPHLRDLVERHHEVGVALELLADELLGLVLVASVFLDVRWVKNRHKLLRAVYI